MNSRIGIMGGMFDPVHNGHIDAALAAVQLLNLEKLLMIPCGTPNHRSEASGTAEHRLQMLNLATREHPSIEVDSTELNSIGVSYTYNTLEAIKQTASASILFFVLGADAFNSLPQWHRWQELFSLCHFVVINRPGFEITDDPLIARELGDRQVENAGDLFSHEFGKIFLLNECEVDLSSSEIREKIESNKSLESDLAPDVLNYIVENELYGFQDNENRQELKN